MTTLEIAVILLAITPLAIWASEALKPRPRVKLVYDTTRLRKAFEMVNVANQFSSMVSETQSPHLLTPDELRVLNVVETLVRDSGFPQYLKPNPTHPVPFVQPALDSLVACGKLKRIESPSGKIGYAPADWVKPNA